MKTARAAFDACANAGVILAFSFF